MEDIDLKAYVGNRIREERKKKRLSQRELGEKIGVKHNTISMYENAANSPEQDSLFKIAQALEIKVDDLFPPFEISSKETDDFERALKMTKDFNIEDMNLLKHLIEKALSLNEKEREKFFDNIKFAVDYYEKMRND